jgi:hypothetical protein
VTSTLPSSRDTTDVSNAPTAPSTVRATIKKPVRPTTDYAPSASNQENAAFSRIIRQYYANNTEGRRELTQLSQADVVHTEIEKRIRTFSSQYDKFAFCNRLAEIHLNLRRWMAEPPDADLLFLFSSQLITPGNIHSKDPIWVDSHPDCLWKPIKPAIVRSCSTGSRRHHAINRTNPAFVTSSTSSDVCVVVNVVTPPLSTAACTQQILLGELSSKCRVTPTLPSSRDSIDVSDLPSSVVPPTTTASSGDRVAVNVVTPLLSTAACTQQILLGELSSKRRVTSTLPSKNMIIWCRGV